MNKQVNSSSIVRQLQVVFAVSIVLLLISSYASFYSNDRLIYSSHWVNHTNEVIQNAEGLISRVKDAETSQRGYIITDDSVFLEPYMGSYAKTNATYEHLKSLTSDNPVQQANLEKTKSLLEHRFRTMEQIIRKSAGASTIGGRATIFLNEHDEMLKGKQIMDDLRVMVERIKAEEYRLLKTRVSEQEKFTKYTPIIIVIAALISISISLLSYFRIKNDLSERLKKQREDELKYVETNERIAEVEKVTQKIASGDYSVRSLDMAKDELGRISTALNEMVVALESSFTELQKRNWMQTGTVTLTNAIRGELFVKNISTKIINSLAGYMDAQVGTLYIADRHMNLKLHGGFAETNAPEEIAYGKGLVGQAVKNREILISDALPADYMAISSSIGNTLPTYAVVLPLVYSDNIIGAIELGLLHKPGDKDIEFLKNNAETIAIGINSAINYEKMQELLEETQAQSEELQAQHNELENINAELEIQTEKLQASEEELRVQQEELQQANGELEERSNLLEERNQVIVEKNIEVQRKAEELALSTKYKSEFLANMSHELRTPLNSILLLSRLLSDNSEDNLSDDQVEYARVIQSSGNGLLLLIDEILDLSKIEAGKMTLEYEPVSLKEIAEDMRGLFEPVAVSKSIAFKVAISNNANALIETDKLRLEQILKNFLSNAMKFTKQGSVTLGIDKDDAKEGYLNFSVTDTGIGIPADKQQLIFEAFQQADGSTRRKYGGTGLGLSISKELSKLLGGTIIIRSQQGQGSTFTVSVPIAQQYVSQEAASEMQVMEMPDEPKPIPRDPNHEYISANIPESIPDDRAAIGKDDKTLLIIEDDTSFARSLLDFTRKQGYKGIVCVRGDEGITLAKQYRPIGILLDIQLPIKSGWEVMEELKADNQTRHIPVHIMSSHSVKKKSLMKGAIDFINKPMAFEQMKDVFSKLEQVLNRTSKKVLIVEENSKHAKALAYFLETFNINSDIKNSIPDSIEALKNDTDCVILDMGIPDSNAYATLEEIKKNPGLEGLPIIVFTGKSLSMGEEHRIKQYADSIIVKTAHSYQRILDEVSLFLHIVEENKPKAATNSLKKLGMMTEVLRDKTVLIVDDDVRNIFSLTKALEKVNMNIITAIDGKEAIEKLNAHKNVDMVLLDMMMPQMDGYETAQRIRQNPQWKRLPVIAVTAKAMTGDREKCIQAGASDYITKPVDIDQLLSLLRVWLYEKL